MSASYRYGKAPKDAPLVWEARTDDGYIIDFDTPDGRGFAVTFHGAAAADAVCQAFHDAARRLKLIKEYVEATREVDRLLKLVASPGYHAATVRAAAAESALFSEAGS